METDSSDGRVTQHLRRLAAGQAPASRLPSVRALMRDLRVSPVTVQRALDRLAHEGVLEARPGQGTFVADRSPVVSEPANFGWQSVALGPARLLTDSLGLLCQMPQGQVRPLNAGYLPEDCQPTALLAAAAGRAMRRPGVWSRMPVEGLPELRGWFAAESGGAYQPHEITICPGTQGANATAFRALAAPGDTVLVESPTYLGALAAAQAAGLRVVPVPMDEAGIRPDLLADAFRRSGARVFYCQPTYANPTGAVLHPDRRQAVLDVVAEAGAFLIEDDWARQFHLEAGEAPPPLARADRHGHVIYVQSLTKCAAPGLRIGAICARGAALERLRAARLVDDFFVPGILQETALQLMTAPSWPRHLRSLRQVLRQRRDGLASVLRRELGPDCLPLVPSGGLHLWVRLPDGCSDTDVEQRAAAQGILVSAGRRWFPAEPPAAYLRLSFAAAAPDWIDGCIATLGSIIQDASRAGP